MNVSEFMSLTPRYFDALVRRHELNRERSRQERDVMIAQLIAMVANTGFRGWEEPRLATEFLPAYSKDQRSSAKPAKRLSFDEKMRRTMERAMSYQAGQVARGLK